MDAVILRAELGLKAPPRRPSHDCQTNPTMHPVVEHFEVMDDLMAQVLREKPGAERLQIADKLFCFARELIESSVRAAHPDWDDPRIAVETARRLSHRAV